MLKLDLPFLQDFGSPKPTHRLPSVQVLTVDEFQRTLLRLDGVHKLVTLLLYGTVMRILEGLRLRVKDVDFEHGASLCVRPRAANTGW